MLHEPKKISSRQKKFLVDKRKKNQNKQRNQSNYNNILFVNKVKKKKEINLIQSFKDMNNNVYSPVGEALLCVRGNDDPDQRKVVFEGQDGKPFALMQDKVVISFDSAQPTQVVTLNVKIRNLPDATIGYRIIHHAPATPKKGSRLKNVDGIGGEIKVDVSKEYCCKIPVERTLTNKRASYKEMHIEFTFDWNGRRLIKTQIFTTRSTKQTQKKNYVKSKKPLEMKINWNESRMYPALDQSCITNSNSNNSDFGLSAGASLFQPSIITSNNTTNLQPIEIIKQFNSFVTNAISAQQTLNQSLLTPTTNLQPTMDLDFDSPGTPESSHFYLTSTQPEPVTEGIIFTLEAIEGKFITQPITSQAQAETNPFLDSDTLYTPLNLDENSTYGSFSNITYPGCAASVYKDRGSDLPQNNAPDNCSQPNQQKPASDCYSHTQTYIEYLEKDCGGVSHQETSFFGTPDDQPKQVTNIEETLVGQKRKLQVYSTDESLFTSVKKANIGRNYV